MNIPRYENAHDVRMRLHNTFARLDGVPVFLRHVGDTMNVAAYDLKTEQVVDSVDASDPRLDISSLPLGYVYDGTSAYYIRRIPYRQQKQGVCSENVMFGQELWSMVNTGMGLPVRWIFLYDTLVGNYMSLTDNLLRLRSKKVISVPVSDKFSLVKHDQDSGLMKLRHANTTIGFFYPTDKAAMILPSYDRKYYKDKLAKIGIKYEVINVPSS